MHHLRFARDTKAITLREFYQLESLAESTRRLTAGLLRVVREELSDDDEDESVEAMKRRRTIRRAPPNNNEPR